MENKTTDLLNDLSEVIHFGLFDGGGIGVRELRERLSHQEDEVLHELDAILIESVLVDDLASSVFNDDESQAIEKWWWHLGKIRNRKYAAGMLTPSLRGIYTSKS